MRRYGEQDTLGTGQLVLPVVGAAGEYPQKWPSASILIKQAGVSVKAAAQYKRARQLLSPAGLRRKLRQQVN